MPVSVQRINRMYRLTEPGGRIAKTRKGNARDGGGHFSRAAAERQARAMNSGKRNRMAV